MFKLEVIQEDGTLKQDPALNHTFKNVITNAGLNNAATSSYSTMLGWCGVGSGSTTPAFTDTALNAQVGSRVTTSTTTQGKSTTTVPYFENDEISDAVVDRIARDSKGKSYKVGKNVTYKEWVNGHATADYAKKINDNPLDFEELVPLPLDIKDYSPDEYKSFISTADTLLDKYSQKEIIDAVVDWKVS